MENILFIAYEFPPKGDPGVHRSLNFVKNLQNFGYNPIVLTIDEASIHKIGCPVDKSLLNGLEKIQIIRTPSREPLRLIRTLTKFKLYRLFWFFLYPLFWEYSVSWSRNSYNKAKKIILDNKIKIVYTSSGPFSPLILGKKLQKNLNIKWVADLRDPFTDGYMWLFPSKLHWYIMRIWEKNILNKPDHLIVNTNEVKKLYLKRKIINSEKITVINNGF